MNLSPEIRYIDFHSHHSAGSDDTVAVMNLMAGDDIPETFPPNTLFSAGIHPWQLTADNMGEMKRELILTAAHPHVVFIGEAGFDRLRGPSPAVQYDVFLFQAKMAEEMGKNLIIHCVRGWDSLRKARREIKPQGKWILHGFRGPSLLVSSLADDGYWFSLGLSGITDKILQTVPADRILLETDDSGRLISDVYRHFTEVSGLRPEKIIDLIRANFTRLFQL